MPRRRWPALSPPLAAAGPVPTPRPPLGQVVFDDRRRLVSLSASGERWIGLLAPDALAPEVPVALQALVSHLAARDATPARSRPPTGTAAACRCAPSPPSGSTSPDTPGRGYAVSIAAAPPAARIHRRPVGGRPAGGTGGQRPGGGGRAAALDRHGARARRGPAPIAGHQHPAPAGGDPRGRLAERVRQHAPAPDRRIQPVGREEQRGELSGGPQALRSTRLLPAVDHHRHGLDHAAVPLTGQRPVLHQPRHGRGLGVEQGSGRVQFGVTEAKLMTRRT